MKDILTKDLAQGLEQAVDQSKKLLKVYESSINALREQANIIKSIKGGLDLGNAKDLETFNKAFEDSNKLLKDSEKLYEAQKKQKKEDLRLQKQLLKSEKEREKALKKAEALEKKLNEQKKKKQGLTDEELKQSIKTRKANADRRKQIEAEIILEKESIDNKRDLQERIKALRIEGQKLDLGSDELKANNDEIDRLTDQLKDNSDQFIQNKINIGNYKSATEDLTDSFEDQKKRLVILEKTYKDFLAQGQKNTRESKELKEALDDQRRSLKNVEEATKETEKSTADLAETFKDLAKATIIIKAIELISELFTTSDSGASSLEKTLGRLTITVSVAIDRLVNGFSSFTNSLKSSFNEVKISFLEFLDSLNTAPIVIKGVEVFSGQVIDVKDRLEELRATQIELGKNTSDLSSIFEGFTEEINKKVEANDRAIDQNLINIRQNALLRNSASDLSNELERLARVYDDDSQSLTDRSIAIKESIKVQEDLNKVNVQIAKNEENLARLRFESSTDSVQAEADYLDAISNRKEVEVQALTESNNLQRESNAINRDLRDLQLDFFIDEVENRINLNDRLIADERITQEERKKLLEENATLVEDSFKRQTEALNKELNDLGKASVDFNELLKQSNEDLTKSVIDLFGESASIRVLEVLKTRRDQTQDLVDAQKELEESDKSLLATTQDIILQEQALIDLRKEGADSEAILEKLERDRFDNKVKNLEKEIDLLEDGSKIKAEKEQELNDLLIEDAKRVTDAKAEEQEKQKKNQEETNKFIRETGIKLTEALLNRLKKESDAKIKALEEDTANAKTRESELLAIANGGDEQASQLASDSLERQRQIERENTKAIEEEKKKQVRLEIITAGLKAYSANAGQPNATGKTIADIGVLLAGLSAVNGSFYEGTDRLDASGKGIDSKGGMLNINHPNEMIIQEDLVKQMGFPSRYDVADVFTRYKDGDLIDKKGASNILNNVIVNNNNDELVSEIRSLKNHLKQSSDPKLLVDVANGIIKIKERKGTRVNNYIDYV